MKEKLNRGYLVVTENDKGEKLYLQKKFNERQIDTWSPNALNVRRFETKEEAQKLIDRYYGNNLRIEEDVWTLNVMYV